MSQGPDPRSKSVILLLALCMVASLGLVVARVAQLQVATPDRLVEHVAGRVDSRVMPARRGELLDRRGRPLATTRFGYRLVADPTLLAGLEPLALDSLIVDVARAAGLEPDTVGERIYSALAGNEARLREPGRSPSRYLRIGSVLAPEAEARVRTLTLPGMWLEREPVRIPTGGSVVASITGLEGVDPGTGIGAEHAFDAQMRERDGSLAFVRDARGRPLWVRPDHWNPADDGSPVRLSIDLQLQRIAHEELVRGVEEADAVGGRLVLVDPHSGEILAMVDIVREVEGLVPFDWAPKGQPASEQVYDPEVRKRYITLIDDPGRQRHPALARNRCIEDVYEPGSTFKTFVWAMITAGGFAAPEEVFDTEKGKWRTSYGRRIEDVTVRDRMSWAEVLVHSSNIGMVKAAERMNARQLRAVIDRFGFGRPTNVGLAGEADGIATPLERWNKYTHTSVPFGHEIAVTPMQMVRAFSVFCREGELAGTLPRLSLMAADEGAPSRRVVERVVPPDVAVLTRQVLADVATKMERAISQSDPDAPQWRYRMFGKSGTAEIPLLPAPEGMRRPAGSRGYFEDQYNSSFVAGAPLETPRLAIIVVIDDPGPAIIRARAHYGSRVAGPVARRVLERSLAYLGVPPSPIDDPESVVVYVGRR